MDYDARLPVGGLPNFGGDLAVQDMQRAHVERRVGRGVAGEADGVFLLGDVELFADHLGAAPDGADRAGHLDGRPAHSCGDIGLEIDVGHGVVHPAITPGGDPNLGARLLGGRVPAGGQELVDIHYLAFVALARQHDQLVIELGGVEVAALGFGDRDIERGEVRL